MKRIHADSSFIRIALSLSLLAAQFGCATSFKYIPQAQVPPEADHKVKFPAGQKLSALETLDLASELKGKMNAFYPGDRRFAGVQKRLENLEHEMVYKSAEDARKKNSYSAYGGIFLPLGLLLLIGTMKPGGDPIDGQAFAEAFWLITLPAQIVVGAAAGYIYAKADCGPAIAPEHQTELQGIVVDYNALVDKAGAE